jgi:transcriptional regulator with XRE-family HTH domain
MTPHELRAWRKAHDLNQIELADLLEVHAMSLSKWERGVHAVPRWVPRILATIDRAERRSPAPPRLKENAPVPVT